MTELVLSPERRDELSDLLRDQERLRAEYPKVAEYWERAPVLSGTDDPRADAAFDMRFIHYMTGGRSEAANPYWDIVGPSVFTHEGRRVVNGGRPEGSTRLGFVQMILQQSYSSAIPSPETIQWVSRFCEGRPVIEAGAGRGYWASQLAGAGLVVDAYDSEPPDKTENASFPQDPGQPDVWHEVSNLDDFAARLNGVTDDVLFLCWPPGWGSSMASKTLAAFEQAGGKRLLLIGEPKGGMTGDDAFFDALEAGWNLESEGSEHVSWWNLGDVAQGWVRR